MAGMVRMTANRFFPFIREALASAGQTITIPSRIRMAINTSTFLGTRLGRELQPVLETH